MAVDNSLHLFAFLDERGPIVLELCSLFIVAQCSPLPLESVDLGPMILPSGIAAGAVQSLGKVWLICDRGYGAVLVSGIHV